MPAAPTNGNGHAPGFSTHVTNGAGLSGYLQAAIERECYRVLIAAAGDRNNALNRAAFALGQFSAGQR